MDIAGLDIAGRLPPDRAAFTAFSHGEMIARVDGAFSSLAMIDDRTIHEVGLRAAAVGQRRALIRLQGGPEYSTWLPKPGISE